LVLGAAFAPGFAGDFVADLAAGFAAVFATGFDPDFGAVLVVDALREAACRRPPLSWVTTLLAPSNTTPGTSPSASATKSSTWCTCF
jgi:hypothetical protein